MASIEAIRVDSIEEMVKPVYQIANGKIDKRGKNNKSSKLTTKLSLFSKESWTMQWKLLLLQKETLLNMLKFQNLTMCQWWVCRTVRKQKLLRQSALSRVSWTCRYHCSWHSVSWCTNWYRKLLWNLWKWKTTGTLQLL